MSQRISNQQASDPKSLLAHGLADQRAELTAAFFYIGCVWGDQSPEAVMSMVRDGERGEAVPDIP